MTLKKKIESSYLFRRHRRSSLQPNDHCVICGERRERKVVRVDFAQTCKERKQKHS